MTKQQLEPILDQLIALGEDAEELTYWREIFDDLAEDQQAQVFTQFQNELTELQKLKA